MIAASAPTNPETTVALISSDVERPLSCESRVVHPQFVINDVGGFMSAARNVQCGLMLATALSFSMLPTVGHAYTQDQQQACTGDAFRLCGSEIPDVDRVTVCMIRNKSQLSPGCRVFFRPSEDERAGAPVNLRPVTEHRTGQPRWHRVKRVKPDAT
jgi:hypothetical protein